MGESARARERERDEDCDEGSNHATKKGLTWIGCGLSSKEAWKAKMPFGFSGSRVKSGGGLEVAYPPSPKHRFRALIRKRKIQVPFSLSGNMVAEKIRAYEHTTAVCVHFPPSHSFENAKLLTTTPSLTREWPTHNCSSSGRPIVCSCFGKVPVAWWGYLLL